LQKGHEIGHWIAIVEYDLFVQSLQHLRQPSIDPIASASGKTWQVSKKILPSRISLTA